MPRRFLLLIIGAITLTLLGSGCQADPGEASSVGGVGRTGEELAAARCGACHLAPAPAQLDKLSWKKGVLPEMAARLGHYHYKSRSAYLERGTGGQLVEAAHVFPTEEQISREELEAIERYYLENAPDTLPQIARAALPSTARFSLHPMDDRYDPPMGTLLKSFPGRDRLIYADAKQDYSNLEIRDGKFRLIQRLSVPDPISDIDFVGDTLLATSMGQFTPTDAPSGSVFKIFKNSPGGDYAGYYRELNQLQRSLTTTRADLDQDGREDLIVSEYGNYTGQLTWYENRGPKAYDRHVLLAQPGAIKTIVRDFDGNGLPDILALMAQGDEGVDIHYNYGNGTFKRKRVLRFPAVYGSANIHLRDLDGDGHEDILYVNGDNADYSMIAKPYHGLRIFLNNGRQHFTEAYFFPLHGAYDARLADFDGDGDLDMVAIAFFPAEGHPEQGVTYLENVADGTGELSFRAFSVPGTAVGRWIKLDVNDFDADGFPDVTLLAFTGMPLGNTSDAQYRKWLESPSVLQLRNTGE